MVVVIGAAVVAATHGAALAPLAVMAAKAGVTAGGAIKGASVTTGTAIASHGLTSVGGAYGLMGLCFFASGVNTIRKKLFNDAASIDKVEPILSK